jgi:hypothetical protein
MTACSRCGATDDRHSVKCYQAMALGLAMGVEARPAAAGQLSDGQISEIGRQYAAPLREQLAAYAEEVQRLRTENEQFRRALDHEGEKLVALQTQLDEPSPPRPRSPRCPTSTTTACRTTSRQPRWRSPRSGWPTSSARSLRSTSPRCWTSPSTTS